MKLVELSKTEFNEFTNYLEICPFEQSIYWANFKSGENWHPYFLGLEDKNKLLGATLLLANENKSIKKRFFYAPQGFLIDYKNYDLLEIFTKEIINFVKEKNGIYLKIDPEILTTEKDEDGRELQGGINNLFIKDYLLKLGFIENDNNTINPKYTMKLDLTDKSLNDILNNMSKKARQIIKRNERLGYIVRELKQDELPIFIKTMDKISSKFNTIEYELPFYEDLASAFTKEHLKIMIAELDLNTTLNNLKKEEKVLQIEKEKRIGLYQNNQLTEETFIEKELGYKEQINIINKRRKYYLSLKEKTDNDKIFLGGYLFLMYGKEITALIGGMDDEYIDLDVSYSIHFKMLKKAIEYGYRSYNFYEVKDVNDGGFFFKQNFGAKLFEHIGEFDYPIDLNSYKKYKKYFPLYYGVKSVYKNK
ncbi:MAG: peptidoglycan bridge formation glycyltransferase FemA/FemB family protein [Clostridium sp.]|nr:peptidoglycan bridge formation glycyltransferase FemA/FemB family protein [Clostridium sp.]